MRNFEAGININKDFLARPQPKFYHKGLDVGSKAERTQQRYKSLLKGQQTLENLGFTQAKLHFASTSNPLESSPDQTIEGDVDYKMEDNLDKPSSQESPDLQVKLEDDISFISRSPSCLSLPLSESEDNVCVWQDTSVTHR